MSWMPKIPDNSWEVIQALAFHSLVLESYGYHLLKSKNLRYNTPFYH